MDASLVVSQFIFDCEQEFRGRSAEELISDTFSGYGMFLFPLAFAKSFPKISS